jgi:hypothetical protein
MKDNVNYLKFTTNDTNHHEQQDNIITKVRGVCLVRGLFSLLCITALALTVVFLTACPENFGFDSRPDEFSAGFVPVEDIHGAPTSGFPYVGIGLTATVEPHNAAIKKIEWSITNQGGTQSSIDGSRLTANAEGTVTVTARIVNGKGDGVDFTKDFHIVISMVSPFKVTGILGIPAALPIEADTYTLHGTVEPHNAAHKNIVWSVVNQGGTGTTVTPAGFLSATGKGTVTLRATIVNGRLDEGDYTQDFPIHIYKTSVIASGYCDDLGHRVPVYWIDGELTELSAEGKSSARTVGVVFAGGRHYIAGYLEDNSSPSNAYLGYWINGGNFIQLDSGSMGYGDTLRYADTTVHSITVDAANDDVYIAGRLNNIYCYWKIVNGVKEKRVDMPNVGDLYSSEKPSSNEGAYTGSIAAYNGSVYLPYKNSNDSKAYYLNENGTAVTIPQLDDVDSIACVAVVNGNVYMGGQAGNASGNNPYYWLKGASDYTVFYDKVNRYTKGPVKSIVEQNGKPVFFFFFSYTINPIYCFSGDCYWDAEGNRTLIPVASHFLMNRVISSDGDMYIPAGWSGSGLGNERPHHGYMVLRGKKTVTVNNPLPYLRVITGIAAINSDLLPSGSIANITAPAWYEDEAVSLTAPQVSLSSDQTIIEQGWQISDDGNEGWTDFTPPSTASMSLNGKYLRYYAKGSSGRMYHSNTVLIVVTSNSIADITAPAWYEDEAVSLTAPSVYFSPGQTIIGQGWQISDNGNSGWTNFTPPSTAPTSLNGKYLRYYATSSSGTTYY